MAAAFCAADCVFSTMVVALLAGGCGGGDGDALIIMGSAIQLEGYACAWRGLGIWYGCLGKMSSF